MVIRPRRLNRTPGRRDGAEPGAPPARARAQTFGWQRTTWTLVLLAVQLTLDTGVRLSPSQVRDRRRLRWMLK
jgi:hypothetical protein